MGRIFYINLISIVCLISSCAVVEKSSETANSSFTEQIWPSPYDILVTTALVASDNSSAPSEVSSQQVVNSSPKNNNIFLVKKNSTGKNEWIMNLGISDEESGISMTFDSFDNVYITGYKRNILNDNKDSEEFTVLLFKYNSYGSREWVKKLGESEVEYGARLIIDSSDNIYVTGFSSEFESANKVEPRNNFLAKYDTSGDRKWIKILDSTLVDFVWDVTFDSQENIYLKGFSENSLVQNNSWKDDIILMKFNRDGIRF